jgi:hypothetical protein
MREAERLAVGMQRQLKAGEMLLSELIRSGIAQPAPPVPPARATPTFPDAKAVAAAAQAFSDRASQRARARADGLAA